jgi:microcystin-dependent protein
MAQGSGQDQSRNTVPYQIYVADANPSQSLAPATVGTTAGGQPHPNLMPYLTLNYCIALQGIFPSRN